MQGRYRADSGSLLVKGYYTPRGWECQQLITACRVSCRPLLKLLGADTGLNWCRIRDVSRIVSAGNGCYIVITTQTRGRNPLGSLLGAPRACFSPAHVGQSATDTENDMTLFSYLILYGRISYRILCIVSCRLLSQRHDIRHNSPYPGILQELDHPVAPITQNHVLVLSGDSSDARLADGTGGPLFHPVGEQLGGPHSVPLPVIDAPPTVRTPGFGWLGAILTDSWII